MSIECPVHSVFKRRIIEKNISIIDRGNYRYVVKSENLRKIRAVDHKDIDREIGNEIIAEIDVAMPLLEVGETFDLCDQNETVVIKERLRNSNGGVTYIVGDKIVFAEDYQKNIDRFFDLNVLFYNAEDQKDMLELVSEVFKYLKKWYFKWLLNIYLPKNLNKSVDSIIELIKKGGDE